MVNEETYRQHVDMKLYGLAAAFREYLDAPVRDDVLTYDERFGLMIGRVWTERQEHRLKNRLGKSRLRELARVENADYRHPRGLDRSVVQRLATCQWENDRENVLVTGATGLGKTWLACPLAHKECREGYTALCARVPRLPEELFVAHGAGTYPRTMERFARPDVLVLDDFGLAPLSDTERRDLLEVIEDRQGRRSTISTSQFKVKHWHEVTGAPTIADAILDRLVSSAHRIDLKGKTSMRGKGKAEKR